MHVVGATTRVVTWRLDGSGAARGRSTRTAILVELRTEGGVVGLGEAAPLPGISVDTLDDAARAIAVFAARLPVEVSDVSAIRTVSSGVDSGAARFAIETALLDALGRERREPASALLAAAFGAPAATTLPVAIVVDSFEQACEAVANGAHCLKLKVGPHDIERVRA